MHKIKGNQFPIIVISHYPQINKLSEGAWKYHTTTLRVQWSTTGVDFHFPIERVTVNQLARGGDLSHASFTLCSLRLSLRLNDAFKRDKTGKNIEGWKHLLGTINGAISNSPRFRIYILANIRRISRNIQLYILIRIFKFLF